jgi:hypothetical protein
LPLNSLLSSASIQPKKRELWAFSGAAWSWSVRSIPQFRHNFTFSGVSVALSSRIKILTCDWKTCSLALRVNLKNTKIGYRSRELWAFSGES